MLSAVLVFAAITALFEAILLLKFCDLPLLHNKWFAAAVHFVAFGINLIVHWGTVTGTMTAVTAALVSFAVYPAVIWLKTFVKEWKNEKAAHSA